jgi:hypothetical protein
MSKPFRYVVFAESMYLIDRLSGLFGPASIVVSEALGSKGDLIISSQNAYKGDYPWASMNRHPLDETILSLMSRAECLAMRMMDRTEKRENFYYRQNVYRTHLRFWSFSLQDIDAIIFQNIPHEVYDFIAYEVAKALDKKTYCFYFLPVIQPLFLSYVVENIYDHSNHIKIPCKTTNIKDLERIKEVRSVLRAYADLQDLPTHRRPINSGKEKLLVFRTKDLINNFLYGLKTLASVPLLDTLRRSRAKFSRYIDPDSETNSSRISKSLSEVGSEDISSLRDFVYFPLHFQPELSSAPVGGYYEDQEMILDSLVAACDRYGRQLVVKVHPRQHIGGLRRSLRRLLTNPDGRFSIVHASVSTHELLNKACAVATISGSIGLEALFASKPVLLFGSRLYELLPGVKRVRCEHDLNVFFEGELKAPAGRASPRWESSIRTLEEYLFVGSVAKSYLDADKHLEIKSVDNAIVALSNHLRSDQLRALSDIATT